VKPRVSGVETHLETTFWNFRFGCVASHISMHRLTYAKILISFGLCKVCSKKMVKFKEIIGGRKNLSGWRGFYD
jgi:hypothetical protein